MFAPSPAPTPASTPLVCNAAAGARAPLPAGCNLGQLARIEALVLLCSVVLALLVFLGSSRRYSSSAMVRFVLWGAFAVSYPLAAYTIGLMQSTPIHHELFLVWSCFFLFVLASSDTITAYSLADVKSPGIILLNRGLQVIYVTMLLQNYSSVLSPKLKMFLFGVWLVSLGKIALSALSYRLALQSDGLQRDNQLITDYMINQTESSHDGAGNPDTMVGYKYIVRGEETDITETKPPGYVKKIMDGVDELVTVERVWQCNGRLLRNSETRRDLCLSFALFKLLRRRCGNFRLAESGQPKTRNLVLNGLLGDTTRAFRVIEVELGFLYDLFYTRYPFVCHAVTTTLPHLAMCAIMVTVGVLALLAPSLRNYHPTHHRSIMLYDINLDVVLTMAIIVLVIVLETFQFVAVLFSNWQKVKVLCRYVLQPWQGNPLFEVLLGVLCYCGSGKYWTRKMSQYSIIRHAILGHPVKDWLSSVTRGWLDNLMFNSGKTRSVKLSGEVQDALASALKTSGGVLSDGCASLKRHKFEQMLALGKACKHATCAHTILIWHIATYICDIKTEEKTHARARASRAAGGDHHRHRAIAMRLSRYCAYLVSSAPELLPDHQYTTQTIAEAVLLDLRRCLHGCTSDEAVVLKLQDTAKLAIRALSPSPDSIHVLGVRLAEDLMKIEEAKRWEVLADFWAELMLFVTPADNATAHVEHLTMGGELITHLWALLTHAGIVHRRPSHATQSQSV